MYVVEKTGEVTVCQEADVFEHYVIADMVFIPTKSVLEILEERDNGYSNVFIQTA